jgi:pimeloyl-ACP methyl ester carboxylesterase
MFELSWPGSVLEFYKMAPLLSKRYNVLMPSIPGYGPSSPPKSGPTFTVIKAATALDAVARALGIEKYVAQGEWLVPSGRRTLDSSMYRRRLGQYGFTYPSAGLLDF